MIIDERLETFINLQDRGNTDFLDDLERVSLADEVPIVRKTMQSLLKFILASKKPKRILEIGTAVGFSSLLMSQYVQSGCEITTIEKYEKRIPIAKANFEKAIDEKQCQLGYAKGFGEAIGWEYGNPNSDENKIHFHAGDAFEILPSLEGQYECIFMDAAKGQYINWLPELLRLLPVGGLLISDNVLQDGRIIDSRFAVERRDRTIHARMREYIYELKHNEAFETVILPVGDGVTLSTRVK